MFDNIHVYFVLIYVYFGTTARSIDALPLYLEIIGNGSPFLTEKRCAFYADNCEWRAWPKYRKSCDQSQGHGRTGVCVLRHARPTLPMGLALSPPPLLRPSAPSPPDTPPP